MLRWNRGAARRRTAGGAVRVAFVTDIMTPYMLAVFDELAGRCELTVLFGSRTGSRAMEWSLGRPRFDHRVVGGWTIGGDLDAADVYPNPALLAELWRARPDVTISGGFSFPSLYAAGYRRATGTRVLIHSDGTRRSEVELSTVQRATRALLARAADGAIGNSKLAAARFGELGFAQVFEAPHSTNIAPFLQVADRREHSPAGELRVAVAGRLIPRKGVDLLLRAVAAARAQGTAVHVTVAGSGEEEGGLRALAAELGLTDVEWVGFVEQGDLPAVFARADVFAFPTRMDPFGIVLLEAAASGLALISSPHAGATGDLVAEGATGFVVEPHDTAELARALARLARDPGLRERMGRAARALAGGRTPASTAEAYLRAAESVLSS